MFDLPGILAFYPRDSFLIVMMVVAVVVFLAVSAPRGKPRCPKCHEHNRDNAIYCAQCGTRLSRK
jgi:predicted amidophosphoribosyltransferase